MSRLFSISFPGSCRALSVCRFISSRVREIFLFSIFAYLVGPICGFSTLGITNRLGLLCAFHIPSLCLSQAFFSVCNLTLSCVYSAFCYIYLFISSIKMLFWSLICFYRIEMSISFQIFVLFYHFPFGPQYAEFIFLLTCSITQYSQLVCFLPDLEVLIKMLKIFDNSTFPG